MLKFLCFVAALLFGSNSFAQGEADFQLLQKVAADVINKYQFELPAKPKLIVTYRPERTPVAATTSRSRICIVIINSNPSSWLQWHQFLRGETLSKKEVFEFAVLHEVGHCINKMSPNPFEPGVDSESFADAYAFSRLRDTLPPEDFLRHIDAIIEARESKWFTSIFTGHNTSKTLELIKADFLGTIRTAATN